MSVRDILQGAAGAAGGPTDPFFNQVTLLVHGDGTNGSNNNTFLDSGPNNYTIQIVSLNNTEFNQGSFSPFSLPSGAWSIYNNGDASTYIAIANNFLLYPGTNPFTIEAWIYRTSSTNNNNGIYAKGFTGSSGYEISLNSSGQPRFGVGSAYITASNPVPLNTWIHIAGVREGTGTDQGKLYVNGVLQGVRTYSANITDGAEVRIGRDRDGSGYFRNGFISNVRFVNGTAVYTSNFTPPTAPLTSIANTQLLTCQSNTLRDNSPNNFTLLPQPTSSAVTVEPISPFLPTAAYSPAVNGGSVYFNGNNQTYLITTTAVTAMPGDFTIEAWTYILDRANTRSIVTIGDYSTTNGAIFAITTAGRLVFNIANNWVILGSSLTVEPGRWNHVAVTRQSNFCRVFLNGVADATTGSSGSQIFDIHRIGAAFYGGSLGSTTYGYISGYRCVVGTALYTSNFTPPTSPPTAIAGTSILLNFTNAQAFNQAAKSNITTFRDTSISTTQKQFGTASLYNAHTLSNASMTSRILTGMGLMLGTFTIEWWAYHSNLDGTNNHVMLGPWSPSNYLLVRINGGTSFEVYTNGSGRVSVSTATAGILVNTWQHYALSCNNTTARMFVNGVQVGSSWSEPFALNTNFFVMFAENETSSLPNQMPGYIDEVRITRGVARYTSNFTPPTAPFPDQ